MRLQINQESFMFIQVVSNRSKYSTIHMSMGAVKKTVLPVLQNTNTKYQFISLILFYFFYLKHVHLALYLILPILHLYLGSFTLKSLRNKNSVSRAMSHIKIHQIWNYDL